MALYKGSLKVCPIVPRWRGFWAVTIKGLSGTIVDCGTQKTIGESGSVIFKFAEAGEYTFIAEYSGEVETKTVTLVDDTYFIDVNMYVGFTLLEYIESELSLTEANSIDLGLKGNQDTITKLDAQLGSENANYGQIFFGTRTSSTSGVYTLQKTTGNQWGMGYNTNSGYVTGGNWDTNRHIFYKNKGTQYIDNKLFIDIPYGTFTTANNLMLFSFGGTTFAMKVYSLQIWQNTTLIRDMVPVKNKTTQKTGLLDKVQNKFYTSITGYNYIAGPEVE